MPETKQEILQNLYTLRAGLSVISEQKDEVENLQLNTKNAVQKICFEIRDDLKWSEDIDKLFVDESETVACRVCGNIYKKIEGTCPICRAKNMQDLSNTDNMDIFTKNLKNGKLLPIIKEEIKNTNNKIENYEKRRKRATIFIILGCIVLLAGIVTAIVGFLVFNNIYLKIFGIIGGIAGVVFIRSNVSNRNFYIYKAKDAYRFHDKLNASIEKNDNAILQITKWKKQFNEKAKPHIDFSNAFYPVLQTTYNEFLDERDWQYLDLIIYFIETNRATTVSEALLLVDTERRNQELINTITLATQAICSTLREGFASVRNAVNTGFASLQRTMQSGFAQLNTTATAQLNATNLSNALQAKANATSEQLVQDVRFMRTKLYY